MNTDHTIMVKPLARAPIEAQAFEMCEHKGIGHPDTIVDGVCEAASRVLSLAYRDRTGRIHHHNLDKGLLIAGTSVPRFGGGELIDPARIVICGRATRIALIEPREIALAAARAYLQKHVRGARDVFGLDAQVRSGSASLTRVMSAAAVPLSNDTSFGVGFAPYSQLEKRVLDLAGSLKSEAFRRAFPAAGDDFKIMAFRGSGADVPVVTLALALIDRYVESVRHYYDVKHSIGAHLVERFDGRIDLRINALDDPDARDESGVYVTVSGLSAEMGDDGQVGRGNRVSGLITPNRPMSLEAVAGKNPVSHVGKLYNVLATLIARDIHRELPHIAEVGVQLLSAIGRAVNEPQAAVIELALEGKELERHGVRAREIARDWFHGIERVTELVLSEEMPVY